MKEQPKVARFRRRGCEHYSLLKEIFSSTTATGKLHYDSTQEPLDSADERELEADFLNTGVHVDVNTEVEDQRKPTAGLKQHTSTVPKDRHSCKEAKESEMSGWKGTANDSRVFLDALARPEVKFPKPSDGYDYVVYAGYTNMLGFFMPYRGKRYHLRVYRGMNRQPRGPMELFNYRHSSLQNVIDRCFGVCINLMLVSQTNRHAAHVK